MSSCKPRLGGVLCLGFLLGRHVKIAVRHHLDFTSLALCQIQDKIMKNRCYSLCIAMAKYFVRRLGLPAKSAALQLESMSSASLLVNSPRRTIGLQLFPHHAIIETKGLFWACLCLIHTSGLEVSPSDSESL